MCANPSWTNVPKTHHKTSDPKIFISQIPLLNFAGAALHTTHVCQPWTNAPKIHHKTSDPQIFISHTCFELCRSSSPCYTTHVSQPILNQRPKTHYKLQIRKFSSHIPVLNFAGTTRNRLHHACVPTLNQRSKDTPQNLRPQDFHLTHPSFELCRSSSPYYTTHVCQPWTNVPKIHHKSSDPKIFISHIPVLNFRNNPEQITPLMCANPSWTNVPKTHHKTSDPKIFISQIPLLNFAGAALHTTHVCQPWTNAQRYTTKPQTLRFSSHTPVLNFVEAALHVTPRMWANPSWTNVPRHTTNFRSENFHLTFLFWTLPEQPGTDYTTHVCQPWTNVPKIHHKTSDPKIFISHIPLLNFAGLALHITPRMCANPSWTNVPRYTTND